MIDKKGFRAGIAVIIINDQNQVFWARRTGGQGWQFPQGGMMSGETPRQAMLRELYEEIGLLPGDVEVLAESQNWLRYYLPKHLVRRGSQPVCIGQKQKWFLLRLTNLAAEFQFDRTEKPEFDGFRWVDYWDPLNEVIFFKRKLYQLALDEFAPIVLTDSSDD